MSHQPDPARFALALSVPDQPPATSAVPAPARVTAPPLEPIPEPAPEPRWTKAKQTAFLQHLAACHCVASAARAVGMSRQSAYRLRARMKGQPFDHAWAAAFDCAFNALEDAAMQRAIHGVEVPYLHKGEVVHFARRFDERLTLGLLRMRYSLLPDPPAPRSEAAEYETDDFPGLLARIERGPQRWEDG